MRTLLRRNSLLTGKNTANSPENARCQICISENITWVLYQLRHGGPKKPARRTGNYRERIRESSSLLAVLHTRGPSEISVKP